MTPVHPKYVANGTCNHVLFVSSLLTGEDLSEITDALCEIFQRREEYFREIKLVLDFFKDGPICIEGKPEESYRMAIRLLSQEQFEEQLRKQKLETKKLETNKFFANFILNNLWTQVKDLKMRVESCQKAIDEVVRAQSKLSSEESSSKHVRNSVTKGSMAEFESKKSAGSCLNKNSSPVNGTKEKPAALKRRLVDHMSRLAVEATDLQKLVKKIKQAADGWILPASRTPREESKKQKVLENVNESANKTNLPIFVNTAFMRKKQDYSLNETIECIDLGKPGKPFLYIQKTYKENGPQSGYYTSFADGNKDVLFASKVLEAHIPES